MVPLVLNKPVQHDREPALWPGTLQKTLDGGENSYYGNSLRLLNNPTENFPTAQQLQSYKADLRNWKDSYTNIQ